MAVTVTRLTCEACGTELTGRFQPCGLCGLGDDDVALVRELLVVGGDLDELCRRTGLGPDVVRRRLRTAAAHLGHDDADDDDDEALAPFSFAPGRDAPGPARPADDTADDAADDDFLERLARGVVEADDALRRLP